MSNVLQEVGFRLLTFDVVVGVPTDQAEPFVARFVTPVGQDAPQRATWPYRVVDDGDGGLGLLEGGDRFAMASDAAAAAGVLEARVVARAVDHFARWGWLVVAGGVEEDDGARTLTIGGTDGARTLLRSGEAVALPLPLPCTRALPQRGPLARLAVVGQPPEPLPTPAALSALVAAAVAPIPGGPRAVVREVSAALRGVPAVGCGPDP